VWEILGFSCLYFFFLFFLIFYFIHLVILFYFFSFYYFVFLLLFLEKCLNPDPDKRIKEEDLIEMKIFDKYRNIFKKYENIENKISQIVCCKCLGIIFEGISFLFLII
jgi:hypothetical protein